MISQKPKSPHEMAAVATTPSAVLSCISPLACVFESNCAPRFFPSCIASGFPCGRALISRTFSLGQAQSLSVTTGPMNPSFTQTSRVSMRNVSKLFPMVKYKLYSPRLWALYGPCIRTLPSTSQGHPSFHLVRDRYIIAIGLPALCAAPQSLARLSAVFGSQAKR